MRCHYIELKLKLDHPRRAFHVATAAAPRPRAPHCDGPGTGPAGLVSVRGAH